MTCISYQAHVRRLVVLGASGGGTRAFFGEAYCGVIALDYIELQELDGWMDGCGYIDFKMYVYMCVCVSV